ncbi:hypothetical protein LCGC14_2425810 [marine sediment metagenome]|uniref:Uncharacterized protein n=1 Tax=marine sediment metagenome TaxID=412755 RepID=A0A0F9BNC2_9ZZZZ
MLVTVLKFLGWGVVVLAVGGLAARLFPRAGDYRHPLSPYDN